MENEWQEHQFVNDTVRQLKSGMTCYAYKEEQVEEIRKKYKDKTGLDLEVVEVIKYKIERQLKRIEE